LRIHQKEGITLSISGIMVENEFGTKKHQNQPYYGIEESQGIEAQQNPHKFERRLFIGIEKN